MPPIEYPDDCKSGPEALERARRAHKLRVQSRRPRNVKPPPPILPAAAAIVLDGDPVIPTNPPSVHSVIEATANYFGVAFLEIRSNRRRKPIVDYRQIGYFVAYHATPFSFPHIARVFHRDHTSIIAGVAKIEKLLLGGDAATNRDVNAIMAVFGLSWPNVKPPLIEPGDNSPLPNWGKDWDDEQEKTLKELFRQFPAHEVARRMGRTRRSIAQRVALLGLSKADLRRAHEEDAA